MTDATKIGRLKARVEGDWWVFSYSLDSGDSRELGRIHMGLVTREDRKRQTLALFSDVAGDFIEAAIGIRPEFNNPQPAPEHEKAGRA